MGQGARKDGRGNEPLAPQKRAMRGNPRRFLEENISQCQTVVSLATVCFACSWMKKWMNLVTVLEDLGIEIGVEFLYYAELCEIFLRINKLGESEILLVAGLSFSDCTLGLYTGDKITLSLQNSIAFVIKLNTPTHNHCKDFHIGS